MKHPILLIALLFQLSWPLYASTTSVDAITAAMQHDLDEAEKLLERALSQTRDDARLYFLCGRIMGQQAENSFISALSYARKSLACLKTSVTLAPANAEYRMGLIRFYLGAPGIAGGDIKRAKEQVDEIYKISERAGIKADVLYLTESEQSAELARLLQHAVTLFPDSSEFHYRLGLQLQQQKQYQDAHSSFKTAAANVTEHEQMFALNAMYQIGRNAVFRAAL